MTEREFECIVVGLGGLGSGAAYWLSRRFGSGVLGLEQFELGHDRGASQDHSRIIRLSYHTPFYVELAKRAYEAWADVEAELGERLIIETGGLDLWPAGAAIPMEDYTSSLSASHVPFEILDAGEVMQRWPQWRLEEDVVGLFQERGGIAPAARCNEAHRRLARAHGATLLDGVRVIDVTDDGRGEITLSTDDETRYVSRAVVLCADAWANELLSHLGTRVPLEVTQEQVTYFSPVEADSFAPDVFPIWIWNDEPCFYGFPTFGEAGPKVAQDCGGRPVTPESRTFDPDPDNFDRVREFTAQHLPGAAGPVIATKTCLYTLTPDRDFVIDAVPGHPNVFVALGAAHGFKFASVIGRILAHLAADERTETDLGPFRLDRFELQARQIV